MPNMRYRARVKSHIAEMLAASNAVADAQHQGVKGSARELLVRSLLTTMLPAGFQIGTGTVIDARGGESKQCDLVVYRKAAIAPSMISEDFGFYPIEEVAAVVEVKTILDAQGWHQAIEHASALKRLVPAPTITPVDWVEPIRAAFAEQLGRQVHFSNPVEMPTRWPLFCVFAFASDLKEKAGVLDARGEVARMLESSSDESEGRTTVDLACAIRHGTFFRSKDGWHASEVSARDALDEVLDFARVLNNTLAHSYSGQWCRSVVGSYMLDSRPYFLASFDQPTQWRRITPAHGGGPLGSGPGDA